MQQVQDAFYYAPESKPIKVDEWIPEPQDIIFNHSKNRIIIPISKYYGVDDLELDSFDLSSKKCYNRPPMREHTCHYLNYFEKFYDMDKELFLVYAKLKRVIDYEALYTKEDFILDLKLFVMSPSILQKISFMDADNYYIELSGRDIIPESLKYEVSHARILMQMSILMNMLIPLVTHFIKMKNIQDNDEFLLEIFDIVLHLSSVDIYSKLYETSITNVDRNSKDHPVLWAKQDIRGRNITTHSQFSANSIVLNIMPKYVYSENNINYNFTSIKYNLGYQIITIGYEFSFIPYSSSERDADENSEYDKYEANLVRQNEGLLLQNEVNCEETMRRIESMYGPFSMKEINYYHSKLQEGSLNIKHEFQQELIFNLFYRYFGDPQSIKAINDIDYIKLMIAAKRILVANGMKLFPYIISSKITSFQRRKSINKKELIKIEADEYYEAVLAKYGNDEKIKNKILSLIATVISSGFKIIDYDSESNTPSDLDGKQIDIISDIISHELLRYIIII